MKKPPQDKFLSESIRGEINFRPNAWIGGEDPTIEVYVPSISWVFPDGVGLDRSKKRLYHDES